MKSNLYRAPKENPELFVYETLEVAHKVARLHGDSESYYLAKLWSSLTKSKIIVLNLSDVFLLFEKSIDGQCEYWHIIIGEKIGWLCVPSGTKMEEINLG